MSLFSANVYLGHVGDFFFKLVHPASSTIAIFSIADKADPVNHRWIITHY